MTRALAIVALTATAYAQPSPVGTAAQMSGYQAPLHGKWFVVCEARNDTDGDGKVDAQFDGRFASGDSYEPYFVIGSGPGMAIDHVAASSQDGRWVAVVRSGKLELFDTATKQGVAIAADVRYDASWNHRHEARFVSIGASKYMTYLTSDAIVIRTLATGAERTVKVKGLLWRAEIEAGEHWARVSVLRSDTNRDGKIKWPGDGNTSLYGCTADVLHRMSPTDGDKPTTLWLELDTGKVVEDPTVLGAVGDELLRRRADDAVLLGSAVVAEPACRGRVAATLVSPPRAVINCGTKQQAKDYKESPVRVVGPGGFKKETAFPMHYAEEDGFTWDVYEGHRFRPTYNKTALDLATGDVIAIPDEVAGYDDNLVLIRTAKGHAVFDLATKKTTLLAGSPTAEASPHDIRDGLVQLGDKQWDAVTGAPIARPGERVHRRMTDGRYLVSPKGDRGPLRVVR